jgi:hypothetical protein
MPTPRFFCTGFGRTHQPAAKTDLLRTYQVLDLYLQNENSEDRADIRKAHKTCFWRSLRVILLAFEL